MQTFLWANGPIADDCKQGHAWFYEHPWNVGQHIPHNEMLDECVRRGITWHIRMDDDCWLKGTAWLSRLLNVQRKCHDVLGAWLVLTPKVIGLRDPPKGGIFRGNRYEAMPFLEGRAGPGRIWGERLSKLAIMGGIFRMSRLDSIRYFRWEERQPMGFGDASQFASYCEMAGIAMVRVETLQLTHGDSTDEQEKRDPSWAHEHDMLQYLPVGL